MQKTEKVNQSSKDNKGILIIAPFFRPSIGGAESYIDEVSLRLAESGFKVYVHAYQPIVTNEAKGPSIEVIGNLEIRRYSWFGGDLFHRFLDNKAFIFLYMTPYLFLRVFVWMLFHHKKISVIDSQGLNAAFINRVLSLFFRKKQISTILALYDFKSSKLFGAISSWALKKSDKVIVEIGKSESELNYLGIPSHKIVGFFWWGGYEKFFFREKDIARDKTGMGTLKKFVVLFVGRAIKIKGADIILEVAKRVADVEFAFVTNNNGDIPDMIRSAEKTYKNINFIGEIDYQNLIWYYQSADIVCIPSNYEENASLVVSESISCNKPVIVSNRGSLPYMVDDTVGLIAEPNPDDFEEKIRYLSENRPVVNAMSKNCVKYAEENFGKKNLERVIFTYKNICNGIRYE
jgi:glycosyltransferase involved in cell wall biosynthesis